MSVSNVTAAGKRVIRQGIRTTGLQGRHEPGQHAHDQHQSQHQHQHQHQRAQHAQNAVLQASLATRVQQINYTIRQLQPRSAALRDPQARKEVETRLKDLARQGSFITQAARELDEILTMRRGVP
eukprot:g3582.t1